MQLCHGGQYNSQEVKYNDVYSRGVVIIVFTQSGKSGTALLLVGSGGIPQFVGIGIGSGVVSSGNTVLITETGTRSWFSTRDSSIVNEVNWVFDYSSVEMSGVSLTEFGLFSGSQAGNLWLREGFQAVTFTGGNELQIDITVEVF